MNPESDPVSLDEVADFAAEVRTWLEVHRASGALNPTAPAPRLAAAPAHTHAAARLHLAFASTGCVAAIAQFKASD